MHDFDTLAGDFILQELAIPHKKDPDRIHYEAQLKRNRNLQVAELSIQIVADQQGDVKGQMMSYNKLKNGVPVEIFPYENESIVLAISKLYPVLKELGMRGPVNIQGRLTDKGLQIFEINARFTGITGLRACMGFNEVEACIKEWLNIGGIQDSLKVNTNRFGMRQVADKAIHLGKNLEVQQRSALINGKTLTVKTTLLLTGATGYLGRNLIDSLLEDKAPFVIFALVRDKKKAVALLPEAVTCFDWEDLENGVLSLGSVDVLLHAGFARPHRSQEELADSLAFTSELFRRATSHQVAHIVNISSQSVYGQADLPPWSETATIAPNTPYGMAKYASELLLESNVGRHQHIQYTSIRLGGLVGGAKGLVEVDVVARLVSKALRSEGIEVKGGMQIVERLDIRDAVTAISALLNKQNVRWEPVYNLGSSAPIRLLDLVEQIVDTVSHEAKVPRSIIAVKDEAVSMFYGMDCASFYRDFEWRPKYSMVDCIKSMIAFKRESDILMAQK
ncbi:hypothetical protein BXU11_05000 [Flavobacterium sp. LM5]|uniref:NAD-dependent epimerase/dehydratase family protein n=1 Tax=Flavobacterium sp. LM5 TaxID=1938610 RepID=UPI000992D164|nr:NAD(P)-dependent oxidoreductase [Flavobacterium sp. LM5]OOV29279.1 hypothetical protein BXU11_05000 [Flavobacterium sp. LM5]